MVNVATASVHDDSGSVHSPARQYGISKMSTSENAPIEQAILATRHTGNPWKPPKAIRGLRPAP